MSKATPISIRDSFEKITLLEGRTPETTDEESTGSFAKLSDYGNGAIYIINYSGNSEWERHPNGDEFVQIIEGETTLTLLINDIHTSHILKESDLMVVPKGVWHRFETPKGVKIMSITPQPSDHSIELPTDS